jgi:hypothetical protein
MLHHDAHRTPGIAKSYRSNLKRSEALCCMYCPRVPREIGHTARYSSSSGIHNDSLHIQTHKKIDPWTKSLFLNFIHCLYVRRTAAVQQINFSTAPFNVLVLLQRVLMILTRAVCNPCIVLHTWSLQLQACVIPHVHTCMLLRPSIFCISCTMHCLANCASTIWGPRGARFGVSF